jgi:hypothetical protein
MLHWNKQVPSRAWFSFPCVIFLQSHKISSIYTAVTSLIQWFFDFHADTNICYTLIMTTIEVIIRCYKPQDYLRCRELLPSGIKEMYAPIIGTVYPYYFRIACFLLVPVVAVSVKWSLWILVLYMISCVIMAALCFFQIRNLIDNHNQSILNSDMLDIEKYYQDESPCL